MHLLLLALLSCLVGQAFLNSLDWSVRCAFRESQLSGDRAAMLRIQLEVQREQEQWALRWGSGFS